MNNKIPQEIEEKDCRSKLFLSEKHTKDIGECNSPPSLHNKIPQEIRDEVSQMTKTPQQIRNEVEKEIYEKLKQGINRKIVLPLDWTIKQILSKIGDDSDNSQENLSKDNPAPLDTLRGSKIGDVQQTSEEKQDDKT